MAKHTVAAREAARYKLDAAVVSAVSCLNSLVKAQAMQHRSYDLGLLLPEVDQVRAESQELFRRMLDLDYHIRYPKKRSKK